MLIFFAKILRKASLLSKEIKALQTIYLLMRIAFDAKRAFQNNTGLGHYSRTLIAGLASQYPENQYLLFAPKQTSLFDISTYKNLEVITPSSIHARTFRSAWRSNWVTKDLLKHKVDLYHGLSHEIPVGISKTSIKSVVTIHDLIFERFPDQHKKIDRMIYRRKFRYSSTHSNKVIAISKQTKQDLVDLYHIDANKIQVCYQPCNPIFETPRSEEEKKITRAKYDLPEKYFLYVGSITERKNLLTICEALLELKAELNIPLVVIGSGGSYKDIVKNFLNENGLVESVIFLNDFNAAEDEGFRTSSDFPAIYQMATSLIYPSIFEGFGIPILEALWSRTPVITSNTSCMPETGGDAAIYQDPMDHHKLAMNMKLVATDINISEQMKEKGWAHAHNFTLRKSVNDVMNVYKAILT